MQPHEAQQQGFRWLPTLLIGLVVLGGFIAVAQHFGFWLDTQDAKHQIAVQQLQQDSPQYHQGWEDKLSADYRSTLNDQSAEGQVPASDLPDVKAAVLGDAQSVCYDYAKANLKGVTQDTPADITAWYRANCSGTAVSLTSPLRK